MYPPVRSCGPCDGKRPAQRIPHKSQFLFRPPEQSVKLFFKTFQALVVGPGKADDMGSGFTAGIITSCFGGNPQPSEIKGLDLFSQGLWHSSFNPDKRAVPFELFQDLAVLFAQDFRQRSGCFVLVFYLFWVGKY